MGTFFIYDRQITFHPTVKIISSFGFLNSNYTFDIVIPSSITQIQYYSFYQCKVSKIIFSKTFAFKNPPFYEATSTIILPNDLTKITGGMFNRYLGVSVQIPEGIHKIYAGAFQGCMNLKTLMFYRNKQCIIIKEGAFKNLPELDTIYADASLTNKISIELKAFQECPLVYL